MDGRLQEPVFPVRAGDGWLRPVRLSHRRLLRTERLRSAFPLCCELFPLRCKLFSLQRRQRSVCFGRLLRWFNFERDADRSDSRAERQLE